MKKRILSLVLVLAMCLSLFTFGATVKAATIGELMEMYKERLWDWQGNQFDAMTADQVEVIENAWANYEENKDALRAIAESFVEDALAGNETFYGTETMKDLYKWKLMRDIMEERIEITNTDEAYVDWLTRFTAYEEGNDEAISASAPLAALGGLGSYSADLTTYFGELAALGVTFEGADADKATAYVDMFLAGDAWDDTVVATYLVPDVQELIVDGIMNGFDIGMQLVTGQITRENTTGVFDMIEDRDMKAAFLLVGEDFVRYVMNELVPGVRQEFLNLPKREILTAVIGDITPILGGDNTAAADAIYDTMAALAKYMLGLDGVDKMAKIEAAEALLESQFGIVIDEALIDRAVTDVKTTMETVEAQHGLELVHINAFLGRELLRYENEGEYVRLNGAEIDGDTVTGMNLGFGHSRFPVFSTMNEYGIASFDANFDADGIKVYAHEENIGQLIIEVTEEADATATVTVYRGYTDEDLDGVVDNEENVYRYVTTFTVTATSDVVPEEPFVELDDVADTTVDGTIEIKGTTNLDHVTVAIVKNGETIYAVVYTKAEFEEGITLNAPDNAAEGDVYTVVVGTEKASASDEFAIEGAEIEYEVVLEDVLDTTADGEIVVKGTTNLDYVTVAIVKGGETIYAVVYTKAEFEAGIVLDTPDSAVVGDVYTVVVGTEKASASDEFTVVEESAEEPFVELEDVLDTTVDGEITVKGTTNLNYVTVAIVKGGETIYAVVYTKAEFEEGITLNAPDNAAEGDVYTVVVGTEKASASDEFAIEGAEIEYEVVLEDVLDTTADGEIVVKGTTNLDYVTVAIVKGGETIYAVVYTKAEFEEGITLNAPDGAEVDDVYTVVVGTEKASASDEFTIVSDEEPIEYEITLDDIADFRLSENENAEIVVKGTTNLDYVVVTIKLGEDNVYAVTHTKAEYEAGITIAIDGAVAGNEYTVAVGQSGTEAEDTFTILEEVPVAPAGTLALTGKTTRTASVGKTVVITTTPGNIQPEGATVEVVWTTEDGGVIEVTSVAGDYDNIATITKLTKGTEKVTATLYVNGVAVDSKVITIKNPSGGGGGKVYTNVTVKVDETKDVVKVPTGGVSVEFIGSGDGEVKLEIVDGVVVVTGVKVGEVKGTLNITSETGKTVLTGDYKFTVTEKDEVVVPEHKCEWPDIAATATKDAHWAHETIDIMTINGYINGYEDGTFKPDQNITRAEFSAIVYRILGLEVAEDGVIYDDTKGHWAEDIIATMSLPEGYGMLRGYGDGNFGPNDNITREQAVAIIARAKSAVWVEAEEGAKDVFTDAEDISWWFDGEMDAAVANGLITGYEDGSYKPLNFTTRAEACVLLARAWPEVLE